MTASVKQDLLQRTKLMNRDFIYKLERFLEKERPEDCGWSMECSSEDWGWDIKLQVLHREQEDA